MNRNIKKYTLAQVIFIMILALAQPLQGQVTIGSSIVPLPGALLDLKMDGTTTKGLGMPRVKLTERNKLYPMLPLGYDDSENAKHAGLLVYHTDGCIFDGSGLYLWDGSEWQILPKSHTLRPLSVDKDTVHLRSGHDARGLAGSQILTATWKSVQAPKWTIAGSSNFTAVNLISPAATGTVGPSPDAINITPAAMPTLATATPWMSYQSEMTFETEECPTLPKTVVLNQTHYALIAKNSNDKSRVLVMYESGADGQIPIQSNATWKATMTSFGVASTLSANSGGQNITDYPNITTVIPTQNITYTPSNATNYATSDITFSDRQSPARFKDVTVSYLHCITGENDLSLEAWANRAGFTQSQINTIPSTGGTLTDSSNNPVTTANGIQLHKDQNGNVFLSGLFGTQRWMLNNLSAKKFDPQRSPGSESIVAAIVAEGNGVPTAKKDIKNPLWAYPKDYDRIVTNEPPTVFYTNNPRSGLFYNWAAATNSKGGANGSLVINDGENVDKNPARRQGICPNGWHLPSDWEWTLLEQEISTNTSQYSTLPNAGTTIDTGGSGHGSRGTTHGEAMVDPCPAPAQFTWDYVGKSNLISNTANIKPGFDLLYMGAISDINIPAYGDFTTCWTASSSSNKAWCRFLSGNNSQVSRLIGNRDDFAPVRCIKD